MKNNSHKFFLFFLSLGFIYFALRYFLFDVYIQIETKVFINFIVLSPVIEEILFRGIIHNELSKKFTSYISIISLPNIIASICFSMIHLLGNSAMHSLMVFIPSLVFGIIYERYQSVFPVILLHSFYNLNVFIIS